LSIEPDELVSELLDTWKRHNDILLFLLAEVPKAGFAATATGSRERDVSRQFSHLNRVRLGWLAFHRTGVRPKLPRGDAGPSPSRAELRTALRASGKDVGALMKRALEGDQKIRLFGKSPVRFLGYLIAHESHHRGQIMIALKKAGFRLSEKVAVQGVWGKWIYGK